MNLFFHLTFMLLTVICLKSFPVLANQSPHHQGLLSSLNLGIRFSSVFENRGVILYKDFQVDPVLAVFFLDDRVEFLGDSIGYRDFIYQDRVRLRTRLVSLTDQPLFPDYESIRSNFVHRPDTYEWSNRVEFFLPGYIEKYLAEIDLSWAKDLSVHHGNYVDLQTKIKLFDFRLPFAETKIEPNLFASVGWGDTNHNQYFYGPSANGNGLNNLSYGLWMAFPEEADRFYPIVQIKHFQVLGDHANAEYAKNNSEGWLFSFIATYGVLE